MNVIIYIESPKRNYGVKESVVKVFCSTLPSFFPERLFLLKKCECSTSQSRTGGVAQAIE
jgi:hypothetical protein